MLNEDLNIFPNNVVYVISERFRSYFDEDMFIARRPLRESDPNESIGISATAWNPNEDSYELKGVRFGQHEPTLQRYLITIQAFVKDADEVRGLARHNTFGFIVRSMLYRDEPLRVGLTALVADTEYGQERLQKWGVGQQLYFSNQIQGTWLYLSTLEFFVETEIV